MQEKVSPCFIARAFPSSSPWHSFKPQESVLGIIHSDLMRDTRVIYLGEIYFRITTGLW